MECDRPLDDWKAYLVEVYEDIIGCEPRKVMIRISSEEPRSAIDKVVGIVDLFDTDDRSFDTLIICINRAPFEVVWQCADDAPQTVRERGEELVRQAQDYTRDRWPDLNQRIAEKHARQAALSHLPDRALIVQVCEVFRGEGERRMLAVFLVPRMAPVMPGIHLEVLASFAAHYSDAFTLRGLEHLVIERDIDFRFMPCRMASEDLVATWRLYLEGLGMLPRIS